MFDRAADFGKLNLKGFRVDARSVAAVVRWRNRLACAFSSSAVGPLAGAGCLTATGGFVVGTPLLGDTASHVATMPPPPTQSAFNVVRVITTV
jgi:hypothetical protein